MENKKMSLWKQSKPYRCRPPVCPSDSLSSTIVSNIITVYGPTRIKEMTNIIASGLEQVWMSRRLQLLVVFWPSFM